MNSAAAVTSRQVAVIDGKRSHWTMEGPGDSYLEWDAEIIADKPGELISWRSLPGSQIENAGSVHFVPAAKGEATEMKVSMTYNPPAGLLGDWISRIFGESPQRDLAENLEIFKKLVEDEA